MSHYFTCPVTTYEVRFLAVYVVSLCHAGKMPLISEQELDELTRDSALGGHACPCAFRLPSEPLSPNAEPEVLVGMAVFMVRVRLRLELR